MRVPAHQLNGEEPMSIINWSQCFNSKGDCTVNKVNWTLEILNHNQEKITVQNLMTGKEFLKQVDRHYLKNSNCKLVSIMLEGYRSDLGIHYKGIEQDHAQLNKRQFKKLCKLYKVVILWN